MNAYLRPRHTLNDSSSTSIPIASSGQSSAIPTDTNIPISASQTGPVSSTAYPTISGILAFTTTFPVTTVTQPSTTFTSFSVSVFGPASSTSQLSSSASPSAAFSTTTPYTLASEIICAGKGLDAASAGLLSALVVPSLFGLILWLIFAILRPRYRQVYGLREWFVQQDLRPKPLGSSFFGFLFPHVPLVPDVPSDVSNAGRSASQDATLFPSDEELNQRTLWVAFRIVLGWSVLALAGALPLYLVSTPCNAALPSASTFGGGYSTLQDLSLLRLLRLLDIRNSTSTAQSSLHSRGEAPIDPHDPQHARIRIIVLTAFALVLALAPALWKIIKEFNELVAYRQRWLEVKCEGKDLGWLSATKAQGFATWGEKQLKDYLVKIGLSSQLGDAAKRNGTQSRSPIRMREEEQPLHRNEEMTSEVDIQSLFSIGDTQRLALLIDERDEILENLEIAETRYISSFRVTTPDPSILDFVPPPPADPTRPYISRPLPLGPQPRSRRHRRAMNRAFASSSLAPTSFVGPSSYYKLRGVRGVSGGRFADSNDQIPSFSDSINSRVIGSRFLEVNRNSVAYGRLPLGSHVGVERTTGELGPVSENGSWVPPIPNPRLFGPNYGLESYDENLLVDEHGFMRGDSIFEQPEEEEEVLSDEWVDVAKEEGERDFDSDFNGPIPTAGPSNFMRRPKKEKVPSTRRETFPLRVDHRSNPESIPPPHLRLQPSQPFVRPLDGLNFDDLGHVYSDITQWRSRLKIINAEIANAQNDSYNDIASGQNVKGWLMVGRGLRYIPGMQVIEGRAKEDIRWDVLQNERSWMDAAMLWAIIIVVMVILAAGLTAAAGLAVAGAPDVAHYLPFLQGLLTKNPLATGIATVLAPAVAATVFIILALLVVNWVAGIHGSVSISGNQLLVFKITFFLLTAVGTIWLVAIGAILFAIRAFTENSAPARSVANGSIYISILALTLVINVAIIFPACLMLQPFRLWRVIRAEKHAVTPRQRFRAVYPRTYNPSFAIGACVLAIVFASTFTLIFPLMAPAVVVLLLLTVIAHRYLVGYVYARTHSQTGGLLQIWLLRRFGTLLSFQPILLGLIFLSRGFWIEGGILAGAGIFIILFVEVYTSWKTRVPGRRSLSPITQNSLERFESGADRYLEMEEDTVNGSSVRDPRTRGSMASVLEMMSLTLAVMPSASTYRGPVPLHTETLDDLTATERAARTHPDAPPHLPPLPFADHAEEMAGILYAPELIAPPPIIWLPNDSAGVARSEAVDLQKYHELQVTLDVTAAQEDVNPRRSASSRTSR